MSKLAAIVICLLLLVLMCSAVSTNGQVSQPKKYVIFRDDDIQPFKSLNTVEAVNHVHIDENVPVTLGIIPHPRLGQGNELLQDGQFLAYMLWIDSNPLFEFAQHGYTHLDIAPPPMGSSEYYGRPYAEQYDSIKQGRDDMTEAFGVAPTTFVPPWGTGDNNTTIACAVLGFTTYCPGVGPVQRTGLADGMRIDGGFDIGATNVTATAYSDTYFNATIQAAENETQQFLANPHADTLCFVYHAGAFTDGHGGVDNYKIQQLINFINFLKSEGVLFTRLDRSSVTGDSNTVSPSPGVGLPAQAEIIPPATVSPSPGAGLPVQTIRGSTLFLVVGSLGFVLFAIDFSARRQPSPKNKPKNR